MKVKNEISKSYATPYEVELLHFCDHIDKEIREAKSQKKIFPLLKETSGAVKVLRTIIEQNANYREFLTNIDITLQNIITEINGKLSCISCFTLNPFQIVGEGYNEIVECKSHLMRCPDCGFEFISPFPNNWPELYKYLTRSSIPVRGKKMTSNHYFSDIGSIVNLHQVFTQNEKSRETYKSCEKERKIHLRLLRNGEEEIKKMHDELSKSTISVYRKLGLGDILN